MKKTILLLICSALLLSIFGCQTANPNADPAPDTTAEQNGQRPEETTGKETDAIVTDESVSEKVTVEEATNDDTETEIDEMTPGIELTFDPSYEPTMQVLEFGGDTLCGIGGILLNHENDVDLKLHTDNLFKPDNETVVCQIGDMTITGTYDCRIEYPYYQSDCLIYRWQDEDGFRIMFDISQDTGKVVRYAEGDFPKKVSAGIIDGPVLSEEECLTIAEKFLYQVLGASGTYALTESEYHYQPKLEYGWYDFTFERYVDHLRTEDQVSFCIGDMGVIRSFFAWTQGIMDGISLPDYNEEEVIAAVEHKLVNIYKPLIEKYSCTYVIDDVCLTRLRDGKLYLRYYVDVQCPLDDARTFYDHTELLVCIS